MEAAPAEMTVRRLIVALALALPCVFAAQAHAYVYWGDPGAGTIGRANNDGSGATDSFIQTGGAPIAVAVNSSYIYWANLTGGTIGRANINGTEVEPSFISGISEPGGVAVTSSYIFWTSLHEQTVGRANLDGSGKLPSLIPTGVSPCGIAVDSGSVYWSNLDGVEGTIGRASFNGTSREPEFVKKTGAGQICGIAVNSANIFWADTGFINDATQIGRANASDGESPNPSLIGDADGPCGIAVFGTQLYWANKGNSMIARANTDGTSVNEALINVGSGEICGVAVDSLSSPLGPPPPNPGPTPPPAPTPPAPTLTLAVKLDKKHGTARLSATVNEAGTIAFTGKGIVAAKTKAHGAETVALTVQPTKAKKATLRRSGRLATKLTVTFTPTTGASVKRVQSVTLLEQRAVARVGK